MVHPDAHDGVDGDEEEGIGEGDEVLVADGTADETDDVCLDDVCAKDDGEKFAHHIEEEWVHAKSEKEGYYWIVSLLLVAVPIVLLLLFIAIVLLIGIFFFLTGFSVDILYEQTQYPCSKATGNEYVAWTPDTFVDSKADERQK